jgi:hypothetical protein
MYSLWAACIVAPLLRRGCTLPPRRGRCAGGAPPAPPPRVRRAHLAARSFAAPCAAAPTQAPAPLVGARLTPPRANLAGVPLSVGLTLCRERSKLLRQRHQRHDRRTASVGRGAPRRRWHNAQALHVSPSPRRARSPSARALPLRAPSSARRPPAPHRAAVRPHIGSAAPPAPAARLPAATTRPAASRPARFARQRATAPFRLASVTG